MGAFLYASIFVSILISVQAGVAEERSDSKAYEDGIGRLLLDELQEENNRDILYELMHRQSRRQTRLEQERLGISLNEDDRELESLSEDIHGVEDANELGPSVQDVRRGPEVPLGDKLNRGLDLMTDKARQSFDTDVDDRKSDTEEAEKLDRRSLLSLDILVRYKTGTSINKFQYYGCFCDGHGDKGPVDNLDRCCQNFNQCYIDLINMNGCGSNYDSHWRIYRYETANDDIKCLPNDPRYDPPECKKKQCECDKGIADCLWSYYNEFNNRYIGPKWNRDRPKYCYYSTDELMELLGKKSG